MKKKKLIGQTIGFVIFLQFIKHKTKKNEEINLFLYERNCFFDDVIIYISCKC
jgi:hypothetical protein